MPRRGPRGRSPGPPTPPAGCRARVPGGASACCRAGPSTPCRRTGPGRASRAGALRALQVRSRRCRSAGTPPRGQVRGCARRARADRRWQRGGWRGRGWRGTDSRRPGARSGPGTRAPAPTAARPAWRELLRRWPQAQRIVVACGPGNNGGDGYVLALQALEAGRRVSVLRVAGHPTASGLARRACEAYLQAGGAIEEFVDAMPEADVVVDALFGIGLARALEPDTTALVEAINAAGVPVLSLDAPSGVETDTGAVPGVAVRADATVQFIAAHAGLRTGAALDHAGELALAS